MPERWARQIKTHCLDLWTANFLFLLRQVVMQRDCNSLVVHLLGRGTCFQVSNKVTSARKQTCLKYLDTINHHFLSSASSSHFRKTGEQGACSMSLNTSLSWDGFYVKLTFPGRLRLLIYNDIQWFVVVSGQTMYCLTQPKRYSRQKPKANKDLSCPLPHTVNTKY